MTTEISPAYKGGDGSSLSSKERQKWGRLRFLDNRGRIRDGKERNLATALTELKRISSNMGLPNSIAKDGASLYRKAVAKKLIRGRSIEGVVAASLYMACRMNQNPRTLDDIGKAFTHRPKRNRKDLSLFGFGIENQCSFGRPRIIYTSFLLYVGS